MPAPRTASRSGSEINGTNVTFDHVNLHGSFVSLYPRGRTSPGTSAASARTGSPAAQRSCNTGDGEPLWIESSATGAITRRDQVQLDERQRRRLLRLRRRLPPRVRPRSSPAQNVTIRNSVFVPDAGSGNGAGSGKIFVTSSSASSSAANGLKLIGNTFGTVKGSYSIQTHTNVQNANGWQIKSNSLRAARHQPQPGSRRSVRQHRTRRSILADTPARQPLPREERQRH